MDFEAQVESLTGLNRYDKLNLRENSELAAEVI